MASASSVANTATIGTSLLADFELLRIDFRVHFETIERRFFGRVGAGGAAKTERELHPVNVAIVGEVDADLGLGRRCWWGARGPPPTGAPARPGGIAPGPPAR